MADTIEILTNGALNSVQDLGRHGFLNIGVSRCGAMDSLALKLGNALVGNNVSSAGIEVTIFPFRILFLQASRIALTGADCDATLNGRPVSAWWTVTVAPGQMLTLGPPAHGARAYLCVAGGLDVPEVLGSRSADLKGAFGGFFGRALRKGDRIATLSPEFGGRAYSTARRGLLPPNGRQGGPYGRPEQRKPEEAADDAVFVRVLPAAQYTNFPVAVRKTFWSSRWKITNNSNRIGYRLEGPALAATGQTELLSHGIVPGVVQVPPGGQPIIQLSDANTAGGYPKIGVVIEPDLWRLAQARLGQHIRFVEVTLEEGVTALKKQREYVDAIRHSINLAT